ncbi:MAG: MBL fold metallo-hydrolase [Dethiosulfovibrio sp.]|nr:MBL fold metallo-hydrolase [Dethiosulfovibrio sp.]
MILLRLTVIVDNLCGSSRLWGEHGLSIMIETPRGNVLFDTGQGHSLLNNLNELDFSLDRLDRVCLSHGHYDHAGGLAQLMLRKPEMEIWASEHVQAPHYRTSSGSNAYIGMDVNLDHRRFVPVKDGEPVELVQGLWAFTVPTKSREKIASPSKPRLVVKNGDEWVEDPFEDDLSLLALGTHGPSLVLGCAHSGVINIMRYVRDKFDYDSFYSVVGGTHLSAVPKATLEGELKKINSEFKIKLWRPNHCTGFSAASALASLHDNVSWASSGTSLEI